MVDKYQKVHSLLMEGMIEKNADKIRLAMSKDAHLIHMTGLIENREEYIKDILDGTLNYYDYEVVSNKDDEVTVRLLAKVYGGSKSWWLLKMKTSYIEEDGLIKIKECKVRMG